MYHKIAKTIEVITAILIPLATHLAASFFFFSHNFKLRKLAAQSQNSNANHMQTMVRGKTTFVAQLAR